MDSYFQKGHNCYSEIFILSVAKKVSRMSAYFLTQRLNLCESVAPHTSASPQVAFVAQY
jgi:hypothetical protein